MLTFFAPIIEIKNPKEKSTFHQKNGHYNLNFYNLYYPADLNVKYFRNFWRRLVE